MFISCSHKANCSALPIWMRACRSLVLLALITDTWNCLLFWVKTTWKSTCRDDLISRLKKSCNWEHSWSFGYAYKTCLISNCFRTEHHEIVRLYQLYSYHQTCSISLYYFNGINYSARYWIQNTTLRTASNSDCFLAFNRAFSSRTCRKQP